MVKCRLVKLKAWQEDLIELMLQVVEHNLDFQPSLDKQTLTITTMQQ